MAPHPTHPVITETLLSVSGVLTEVLSIATSAPAVLQVLIIPGNPGNAGYYKVFMQQLHAAFDGKAHVVACSHAGHELGPHNLAQQLYDVHEQIQHKADFIKQHLLLPGRPPLMVLAHSIGSYMALHAIREVEKTHAIQHHYTIPSYHVPTRLLDTHTITINTQDTKDPLPEPSNTPAPSPHPKQHSWWPGSWGHHASQVEHHEDDLRWLRPAPPHAPPPIIKVVAMMPFFQADFKGQFKQRLLRLLARRYAFMSLVAHVVSSLPMVIRMALVNWWTGGSMSKEAVRTTCELLHRHTIHNNFYLANHEFELLDGEFDWGLLQQMGSRVHVLACPDDVWMSQGQFKSMLECVPGLQASWHTDLQHAFCVSTEQSRAVTEVVKSIADQHFMSSEARNVAGSRSAQPPAEHMFLSSRL